MLRSVQPWELEPDLKARGGLPCCCKPERRILSARLSGVTLTTPPMALVALWLQRLQLHTAGLWVAAYCAMRIRSVEAWAVVVAGQLSDF